MRIILIPFVREDTDTVREVEIDVPCSGARDIDLLPLVILISNAAFWGFIPRVTFTSCRP